MNIVGKKFNRQNTFAIVMISLENSGRNLFCDRRWVATHGLKSSANLGLFVVNWFSLHPIFQLNFLRVDFIPIIKFFKFPIYTK